MCMNSFLYQQVSFKSCKLFCSDEIDSEMHAFRSRIQMHTFQKSRLKRESQLKFTTGATRNVWILWSSGLYYASLQVRYIGYSRAERFQKMCANPQQRCAWSLFCINKCQWKNGKLFCADEIDSEMHAFRSRCILFKNQDWKQILSSNLPPAVLGMSKFCGHLGCLTIISYQDHGVFTCWKLQKM